VKRSIDVVLASVALVLLSPLMLVAALAVRLTLGSPVLFRQQRAGRGGQAFELLKFRSMRAPEPGQEGPTHDMQRLSRLGSLLRKTSVDELPSLLNVLRGDLSLVGPRPLPMAYVARYSPEQARRLEVRPGLTGWAVVHGRNRLSWEQRFELDCWYVDHQSIWLDLRILLRSVALVLRGSDVNHGPALTMSEFRGDNASHAPVSASNERDTHG